MRHWYWQLLALGMWGMTSSVGAAPIGDAVAGKAAFTPCASCHQIGPGARGGFAPQLNGVLGRKAGSTPDYAYSPALRQAGWIWTEPRLAAFIHDPDKVVPGTTMRFVSWGYGEQKVADLLAYLRTFQNAR